MYRSTRLCHTITNLRLFVYHGYLTGKLSKCVQYDCAGMGSMYQIFLVLVVQYINMLKLYMYQPLAKYADGQEITFCTDICLLK